MLHGDELPRPLTTTMGRVPEYAPGVDKSSRAQLLSVEGGQGWLQWYHALGAAGGSNGRAGRRGRCGKVAWGSGAGTIAVPAA